MINNMNYNNMRYFWRTLKTKWSLYKLLLPTLVAWIFSILSYYFGIVLSNQETSMSLARSGAAATAIFILSTVFSVDHLAKSSEKKANEYFSKITHGFPNTGKSHQARIEQQTRKNTEHLVRANLYLSAAGLCLATLVWGFGDLVADGKLAYWLLKP
jgi:hypothetical protein